MYSGTTLYQSGTVESVNGTTLKINRASLQSSIADLSTHIYETSAEGIAYWYIVSYTDALAPVYTVDIFKAVQTRSVWLSFDYDYKIYMMNRFGVFEIMPVTYLLAYYTQGWTSPGISTNFRLPNGTYFNKEIVYGVSTDFTGTFSGQIVVDFFSDMYDGNYQLSMVFKTYNADIVKERPRRSNNPYDVYSELKISNIQFFNCQGTPIVDGNKCLITNRSFTGIFT